MFGKDKNHISEALTRFLTQNKKKKKEILSFYTILKEKVLYSIIVYNFLRLYHGKENIWNFNLHAVSTNNGINCNS